MVDVKPTILDLLGIEGNFTSIGETIFTFEDHLISFRDGSYINGDEYFHTTIDGLFEEGVCFNINDFSKKDASTCRVNFYQGIRGLQISDLIITNNILDGYLNK
jgi:hypothetical protein